MAIVLLNWVLKMLLLPEDDLSPFAVIPPPEYPSFEILGFDYENAID